jgi:hypothetical protein
MYTNCKLVLCSHSSMMNKGGFSAEEEGLPLSGERQVLPDCRHSL